MGGQLFFHFIDGNLCIGVCCLAAGNPIDFRCLGLHGLLIGKGLGSHRGVLGTCGHRRVGCLGIIASGKRKYAEENHDTQAGGRQRTEACNPFFFRISLSPVQPLLNGSGKGIGKGYIVIAFFSFIHNSISFLK